MGLGDEAWGHYAFFHEPLERKLSKEQKASYTKLAMKCGREEGVLLKTANPQKTVLEITRDMGIRVETPDIPNGGGHVTFAQYEETGKIIIFMDCIKKADDLIRSEGMEELFLPRTPGAETFQRAESQLYKACYEVRTRGRSTFKDSQSTKDGAGNYP